MPRKIDPNTIQVGDGSAPQSSVSSAVQAGTAGSNAHLNTVSNAHPASAITIDQLPEGIFSSSNVEGALDELSGLIPPRPPIIGAFKEFLQGSGIPDWGSLKLSESRLDQRAGATSTTVNLSDAYGYYYKSPTWADDNPPFTVTGADPVTDPYFNVEDLTYTGGGEGQSFVGGVVRAGSLVESARIMNLTATQKFVVVSGIVHPSDRGVLTLLRWPSGGDVFDFLAQPLTTRCLAAILLGNGILVSSTSSGCDGTPGGIFSPGTSGGTFDPYTFPGAAGGQYNLRELHTGVSESANPVTATVSDSEGQVRLGTDVNAGIFPVAGGIPILGAGSVARGGGDDSNFFRYRLPLLDDYSDTQGLKYTPSSEKVRFFSKTSPASADVMTNAGFYDGFVQDYWPYQVSRYRHRFGLDNTATFPNIRESGSYILVHFKTESSFEALVRDGVAPADEDLYSANLVDWSDLENPLNVANNSSPFNASQSYHVLRSTVTEDNGPVAPTLDSESLNIDPDNAYITSVSGVHYFSSGDGSSNRFQVDVSFDLSGVFGSTVRTGEESPFYYGGLSPFAISLSHFTYSATPSFLEISSTPTPEIQASQRIEYTLEDLGYDLVTPPNPVDLVSLNFEFACLGDDETPSFCVDSKIRSFVRHPEGHKEPGTTNVFEADASNINQILFHSGRTEPLAVDFGNPVNINIVGGLLDPLPASLFSYQKDVKERFLDEVYRFRSQDPLDTWKLNGPGLPPVDQGFNDVSVRDSDWLVPSRFHELDLSDPLGNGEAQIAGLPFRSPLLTDGFLEAPLPSSGQLIYPKLNYNSGTRPKSGTDHFLPQPNYSTLPGTGDRSYVRLFDVAFSRDPSPVSVAGETSVILKITGVQLFDFEFDRLGTPRGLELMVKIPGFTTWMDLGRRDGDGPSKQDPFLDGSGCQVIGLDTKDDVDSSSGLVTCQVKINVGPSAAFYLNSAGESILAIKATIKDNADGQALEMSSVSTTPPVNLRALSTIEIVKPTS